MITLPMFDDRKDPSHVIRSEMDRRRNRILFHLLKVPFRDSDNNLVSTDRRSGFDRRNG